MRPSGGGGGGGSGGSGGSGEADDDGLGDTVAAPLARADDCAGLGWGGTDGEAAAVGGAVERAGAAGAAVHAAASATPRRSPGRRGQADAR